MGLSRQGIMDPSGWQDGKRPVFIADHSWSTSQWLHSPRGSRTHVTFKLPTFISLCSFIQQILTEYILFNRVLSGSKDFKDVELEHSYVCCAWSSFLRR